MIDIRIIDVPLYIYIYIYIHIYTLPRSRIHFGYRPSNWVITTLSPVSMAFAQDDGQQGERTKLLSF